jgi:hypothetical protein
MLIALGLGTAAVGLCAVQLYVGRLPFEPPMDYIVRAEFQELPTTDEALQQWLLQQPGVYIGFVRREGNTVILAWGHTRTHFWDPITPDVRVAFNTFGYKGLAHYSEEKEYRDK